MRKLAPDELALWRRVAATIRPFKSLPDASAAGEDADSAKPAVTFRLNRPLLREPRPPSARALTLGDGLDASWERRIRQGTIEPDRELDLHGFSLDHAWVAIDRLLDRAWSRHERVILLVTCRERADPRGTGRGRIRAALKDWLEQSRHAPHIAAVRGAHRRHGGPGSVYVIMRRR